MDDEGKAMVNHIVRQASVAVNKVRYAAQGAKFLHKMGL